MAAAVKVAAVMVAAERGLAAEREAAETAAAMAAVARWLRCKRGALACASALFARYNESLVICQFRSGLR